MSAFITLLNWTFPDPSIRPGCSERRPHVGSMIAVDGGMGSDVFVLQYHVGFDGADGIGEG